MGELLLRSGKASRAIAALEQGMQSVQDTEILMTLGVAYGQISHLANLLALLGDSQRSAYHKRLAELLSR